MILGTLESLYAAQEERIERWLALRRAEAQPFVTTSVDLRHSGLRLAPVDTNLYPAGFNNLSPQAETRAARFFKRYMEDHYPQARRVLIVPENHTRNLPYLDSLAVLKRLIGRAGLEAEIGSLRDDPPEGQARARRSGVWLETEAGFRPEVILLNNDCSAGVPPLLAGIAQPVLPPVGMGWWRRRKSVHFTAYRALVEEFAGEFGLDPWLIAADFHACGQVDFKQREGLDCLAKAVDGIIERARAKHAEYGMKEEPYAFVKADSGTYGMGIMTVRSGSEILEVNKKERNKMHVVKEGVQVSEVIVQEGIPTVDRVHGNPAEPMIYLIDGVPVGGMWRINAARDAYGNLNAAGMEFTGMCDEREENADCREPVKDCNFRAFGLIAALAALAAGREAHLMGEV